MSSLANDVKARTARTALMIEYHAKNVRRTLGVSTEKVDALSIFERLDEFSLQTGRWSQEGQVRPDDSLGGAAARTMFEPFNDRFIVALSESIYSRLEADDPWSRFVVAHEIGHVTMHREEVIELSVHSKVAGLARTHQVRDVLNAEWQANLFGLALLAPAELISKEDLKRPGLLAKRFGITTEQAFMRAAIINKKLRKGR